MEYARLFEKLMLQQVIYSCACTKCLALPLRLARGNQTPVSTLFLFPGSLEYHLACDDALWALRNVSIRDEDAHGEKFHFLPSIFLLHYIYVAGSPANPTTLALCRGKV